MSIKGNHRLIKKWVGSSSHKAYSYKEAGCDFAGGPGARWWLSYRHQLEEFVNRVKGSKTQYWITGKDYSINQMRMLDVA